MALAFPAFTITMLDAEYAVLNEGLASPNISPIGSFGAFPAGALTASSSAGTTTITLNNGFRTESNIRVLAQRVRRAAQVYRYTVNS